MLKKLTEEKQNEILEAGIRVFAEHGLKDAGMSEIAREAGISVGVLYKYYADKEDFFLKCLKKSLSVLEDTVGQITAEEDKPINYARQLVDAVIRFSRENPAYVRMYHEITSSGTQELAAEMAEHIEGMTSRTYTEIVARAQRAGSVRSDLDPAMFAMFMDNLLMMLQFTYSCPYYRERYRLYRGRDIAEEDELVADQLIRFLESAFTLERDDFVHTPADEG